MSEGRCSNVVRVTVGWVAASLALGVLAGGCGSSDRFPPQEEKRFTKLYQDGLAHADPYVRAEVVRVIGIAGDDALLPLLTKAAEDDDLMVRVGATIQLARLKPDEAKSHMTKLVTHDDAKVRRAALGSALARMPFSEARSDVIDIALRSDDAETRYQALLYGLIPELAQLEDEEEREPRLRALSRLVDHADPRVAGVALRLLHEEGRAARAKPVLERASSDDVKVQGKALRVLAEAGIAEFAATLKALTVPEALAGDLGMARVAAGDLAALEQVRAALAKAEEEVVTRALRALGRCEGKDAYRLILSQRQDSRVGVRQQAYYAMALHPSADAKDFKRGLRDRAPEVIEASIIGLIRSEPRFMGPFVETGLRGSDRELEILTALLSVVERLGAEKDEASLKAFYGELSSLSEPLAALAAHQRPEMRAAAAEVLFHSGDPLEIHGQLTDPDSEVTWAMLDALARRPGEDDPLKHVELFRKHGRSGAYYATRLICAAGIWRAYRIAAKGVKETKDSDDKESAAEEEGA